ncbi:MAG: LuxR C-terminal-related transcriptional regulator, partial [Dehalococcoidia bacterium]
HQTDLEPATRQLGEAAGLFRELGDTRMLSRSLLNLGHVLNRSDPAAGYALYQESLALARAIDAPRDLAEVVTALGSAETYRGNPGAALPLLEEGADLYRQAGDRYGLGLTLGYLGFSRMLLSDSRSAWEAYRKCLALCHELGEKQGTAVFLLGPAALLLDQGEARRAAVLCGVSEVLCEVAGTPLYPAIRPLYEATVRRMRTRLGEQEFAAAWAEGRERDLGDAIAEIQRQPLPEARTAALSPASPDRAGHDGAQDAIDRPGGLSPREWEVLGLLAAGLSNRRIGDALALSARTVERHIANIYAKIGAHGRAEATTFALRNASSQTGTA